MLEFYFSYRGVLKRLRSGALGAEMDRIAGDLHSQGYKPASAKLYLSRIARFSQFAAERCGSEPISATIVDRYLLTLGAGSPRIAAVTALQYARRVAPNRFVTAVASVVDDPDAALLSSFSNYLSKVRGLEPKSRDGALLGARRFLQWFRIRHPGQDLATMEAQHVIAAAEHQLSLSAASSTRTAATSHIRGFLRFLHWAGHHHRDLSPVVPRTPHWRLAHLPPRLSWTEVRRAIDTIGRATPIDVRDRALLLFLARTGARVSEAIGVNASDLHLQRGHPQVLLHGKGRRDRVVPIPRDLVRSLTELLKERGLAHHEPQPIFVGAHGERLTRFGATHVVRRAAVRAKSAVPSLDHKPISPHIFRHSLAMKLLRSDVDLLTIQAWLGHAQVTTTHRYAAADVEMMRRGLVKAGVSCDRSARFQPKDAVLRLLESI